MNKLTLDFSQDRDLVVIEAKVLPFLKVNAVDSGTVICYIRGVGKVGAVVEYRHYLDSGNPIETHASMIAEKLAEYSKGKDGYSYSGATLEVRHP